MVVCCVNQRRQGVRACWRATSTSPCAHRMYSSQFAVEELRQLSDSGVYETIRLERIVKAAQQVGTATGTPPPFPPFRSALRAAS